MTQLLTVRALSRVLISLLLLCMLAACKKEAVVSPGAGAPEGVAGISSKAGGFLAYTHTVGFEVDPDSIAGRIAALQSACNEERFGACSVLSMESTSGRAARGSIAMRVVPAAVEALVKLGGEGTQFSTRQTSAEDLADAVADVSDSRDLLTRQRAKLLEFSERKDLAVSDLIALSENLAAIDSRLQLLAQESAQQRRRIETNHLTLNFASNLEWEDESDFSLSGLWDTFASNFEYGIDGAAEYAGFLLPIVVLFFPLALLWRWAWRWATRSTRAKAT